MLHYYESTRNKDITCNPSEAIIKGLSDDGGLFVLRDIETMRIDFDEICKMSFSEIAEIVLKMFLPDFTDMQIKKSVMSAYDEKFRCKEIVPLVKVGDSYIMELFHGKTLAFKDIALSILPYLMINAKKNSGIAEDIVILTATSGDTGKAALEGFKDVEGVEIIVFYPGEGVSKVQKMQMITQEGSNTHVVAVEGNFDDAQSAVKRIFGDENMIKELKKLNKRFSSANSINIGRLIPQINYYINTYCRLLEKSEVKKGEKINFVVPTGNFGNILAGYFASVLGVPVNKLICASNENNVLYDFIRTGEYDINREFIKTISPSMDILISSNLERLLYYLSGKNNEYINELMKGLKEKRVFRINDNMKKKMEEIFWSSFSTEEDIKKTIKKAYVKYGYLMDTHTAVAYKAYEDYREETGDNTCTVILSTASPFKFSKSVYDSLFHAGEKEDEFEVMQELSEKTGEIIPDEIKNIHSMKVTQKKNCRIADMKEIIIEIISGEKNV